MLTPSFELTQDDTFLTIIIKARYAKITEAEIYVDGSDFKFYSKPYFLRLTLPGRIIEDGRESAKYDVEKGHYTITVPKETPGEYFDGLDMLTTLLAPGGKVSAEEPVLEIHDGDNEPHPISQDAEEEDVDEDEEDDIDWQVPQEPYLQDEISLGGSTYYGFANRRTGVFERLQNELCGIVDIVNPDSMSLTARREGRHEAEQLKFDEDHYIGDFLEDDCIQCVLEYKTPWHADYKQLMKSQSEKGKLSGPDKMKSLVTLSEEEKDQMIKLPKKTYLLDQKTEASVLLGLVDILFAYAYDIRTTEGEHSVESAWTICKLSSTLSWMDWFTSLDDVINACFTRGLAYPLYRHWQLNLQVLEDVITMFQLGRKQLLKCLLDIHQILSHDEPHYILNDLYITDYCVWIQSISKAKIHSLAQALNTLQLDKAQIPFDLKTLENAAQAVKDGNEDTYNEDSESTSGESSDDIDSDDDTDSDDTSADEGDDECKDVMDRLTNVGRVQNKKRTHTASKNGDQPCYYQYGYPEVLQTRHQHPGAPNDDDDTLADRPLSDCHGNDLVQEALILEHFAKHKDSDCQQEHADLIDNEKHCIAPDDVTSAPNRETTTCGPDENQTLTPSVAGSNQIFPTSQDEFGRNANEVDNQLSPSQDEFGMHPINGNKLFPTSQDEFGMHQLEDIAAALDDLLINNSEDNESEGALHCISSKSQPAPPSYMKCSQSSHDELVTTPSQPSSSGILSPSSQDDLTSQIRCADEMSCREPLPPAPNCPITLDEVGHDGACSARFESHDVEAEEDIDGYGLRDSTESAKVPHLSKYKDEHHESGIASGGSVGRRHGSVDRNEVHEDKTNSIADNNLFESWIKSPPQQRIEMFPDN